MQHGQNVFHFFKYHRAEYDAINVVLNYELVRVKGYFNKNEVVVILTACGQKHYKNCTIVNRVL